ncbi:restriction endonuclease [Derxia gummosa]|uniref:Restriction endonuclease n=1 Tax=Derxia gummosa DSM 723 TaxID=1121388 RepID=A0A8B6X0K4_9BURK|nr:restriction endonuclease [Derxia gummosa]
MQQTFLYLAFLAGLGALIAWAIRHRLHQHRAATEEREARRAHSLGIDALVRRPSARAAFGGAEPATIEVPPPTIPHAVAVAAAQARGGQAPIDELFDDMDDTPLMPGVRRAAGPVTMPRAGAEPNTIAARGAPTRTDGSVTIALNSMLVTSIQPTQIPRLDGNNHIQTDTVSLDYDGLMRLERVRFARVALAYQQSHGFRARRFAGKAPIDVLMALGESPTPVGALRASRRSGPAQLDELHAFHTTTKALHIKRAFFVAQEGMDEPAEQYANKHNIVTIDARKLAAWIETTDPKNLPRLLRAARGKQKD